jgi:electron transport complex protein RnfA
LNLAVLAPACWLIDHRAGRWLPRRPGFLLLMTSQSTLLGVPLLGRVRSQDFIEACGLGIGAGISFALLLLAFSSMQLRMRATNIPAPFRQAPIGLITLGIMALAVMGFTGLIRE